MADVEFNEPQYAPEPRRETKKESLMSRLVISFGLAKDEAGAQRALAIAAAAFAVLAIAVYFIWGR